MDFFRMQGKAAANISNTVEDEILEASRCCAYCHSLVQSLPENLSKQKDEAVYCCLSCRLLDNWFENGNKPEGVDKLLEDVSEKWESFNFSLVESKYAQTVSSEIRRFEIYIEGLQCSSCVHLLEYIPEFDQRILLCRVDFAKQVLWLETSEKNILGSICQLIESFGYLPSPIQSEKEISFAKSKENRSELMRIGVAAAISGNEMLFSIPIYAGLTGELASVFKWISFFLFLPIVLYVAVPFYKKAWVSIMRRHLSVDTMIVVALLAGFFLSTYSLFIGKEDLYFDSTASFIFLITATRFGLKRYQQSFLANGAWAEIFSKFVYFKDKDKKSLKFEKVSYSDIQSGEVFITQENSPIPCDCELVSAIAEFDLSFLTGEATPQLRHRGDKVMAGSLLLSASEDNLIFCKAHRESAESDLAQMFRSVELNQNGRGQLQTDTDRLSHWLTACVFFIAAVFFILAFPLLGAEAFKRCLALITIACPCAIAFGTPLAYRLGIAKAVRNGIFFKSEGSIESLANIKRVAFDKTGTLTSTDLVLAEESLNGLSLNEKELILGLEKASVHPIAQSLRRAWSDIQPKSFDQVEELAGKGVHGKIGEDAFQFYRYDDDLSRNEFEVLFSSKINGKNCQKKLRFIERLEDSAPSVISELRRQGVDVFILSGDTEYRTSKIAESLGISQEAVFAEKSPAEKQKKIAELNPCLYVGDGLNDLLALSTAAVSFALKGSFQATTSICDIYAPKKDLSCLLTAISTAKLVTATVRMNLFFAILYNAIGGFMSLAGYVNPLVAAVLMPISSLIITTHTLGRVK